MSGKKKHRSANEHLQYLKGELSSRERYAFEKDLEADPFEQEAMEGLENLGPDQAEQDILYLHNRLRKRLKRRRRVAYYSIAATVASLLIVGTIFLKVYDFNPRSEEKQVYREESYDSDPSSEQSALAPVQSEPEINEPGPHPQEKDVVIPEKENEAARASESAGESEAARESEAAKGKSEKIPEMAEVELQEEEPAELESYDFAVAAPAPENEVLQEDQITHVEAEPRAEAVENQIAPTERKAARAKKSIAQPVSQAPQAVSNEIDTETELRAMLATQVSGVVISSEDMEPIPGAMVEDKILKSYVVTDLDGRFDIPVQEDSPTTLAASFIGMETQEHAVEGGMDVEFILKPDPLVLEEVVVVGQVSYVESTPTGAVQVVKSEKTNGSDSFSSAEPAVGYKAYKSYIEDHIQFPVDVTDTDKAVVILKFQITRKGKIKEITALRSPAEPFSIEAIRLVKEGPSWIPASNADGPLDDWIRIRIVFKR